jgi:hypothetical protein
MRNVVTRMEMYINKELEWFVYLCFIINYNLNHKKSRAWIQVFKINKKVLFNRFCLITSRKNPIQSSSKLPTCFIRPWKTKRSN